MSTLYHHVMRGFAQSTTTYTTHSRKIGMCSWRSYALFALRWAGYRLTINKMKNAWSFAFSALGVPFESIDFARIYVAIIYAIYMYIYCSMMVIVRCCRTNSSYLLWEKQTSITMFVRCWTTCNGIPIYSSFASRKYICSSDRRTFFVRCVTERRTKGSEKSLVFVKRCVMLHHASDDISSELITHTHIRIYTLLT